MPKSAQQRLIAKLPKVELHIHIEGSLEPEQVFTFAERNHVALPYANIEALRAAYSFADLQSFLDLYYATTHVLQTEQDFYELALAYGHRAARDNVRHAEIFFDPQSHTVRGVPMAHVIGGLRRGLQQAEQDVGITASLILCFLRHLSEAQAHETLAAAMPFRDAFIGVGLDSAERDNPPEKFARVFAQARKAGLHVVAHAGEEGPPAYIRQAIDLLKVERIDHGVRCIEDPTLVQELAQKGIPLTVCPLSNAKLQVTPDLTQHPLKELLEAGVRVTVNADDPAYFGGTICDNYEAIATALNLHDQQLIALAQHAIDASFLPLGRRQALTKELNAVS